MDKSARWGGVGGAYRVSVNTGESKTVNYLMRFLERYLVAAYSLVKMRSTCAQKRQKKKTKEKNPSAGLNLTASSSNDCNFETSVVRLILM